MAYGCAFAPRLDELSLDRIEPAVDEPQGLDDLRQAFAQGARNALIVRVVQDRRQVPEPEPPLGGDDAELRHQAANVVRQHRMLLHQDLAHPVNAGGGLLGLALDRHEAHRRATDRLADRLGVRRVVLVPPHVRLCVGWRDQPNIVPQLAQFARPVVRRPARLHADQAGRQLAEKRQHLRAPHGPAHHDRARPIDPVHLKNLLRDIDADHANLFHGWLHLSWFPTDPTLAHQAARGPSTPSSRGAKRRGDPGAEGALATWIASLRSR